MSELPSSATAVDVILGLHKKTWTEGANELYRLIDLEMNSGYWLWDRKKQKQSRTKIIVCLKSEGRRFFDSVKGCRTVLVDDRVVEIRVSGRMRNHREGMLSLV